MTQRQALEIMKTGANVFLTGAAGSGKTYVLNQYIQILKERDIPIGITASTGIAATHMGGMTIHSWAGIGINDSLTRQDIEEIGAKDYVKKKVATAKVLVIDEISMMHDYRLDLIDRVTRYIRKSDAPFGGLQIILCGDFFQLPPIERMGNYRAQPKSNNLWSNEYTLIPEDETFAENLNGINRTSFAYHSKSWQDLNLKICYLEEQHRQDDPIYTKILNDIRGAKLSFETKELLKKRIGVKPEIAADIEPTRLYSHNMNVDVENEKELAKLPGVTFEYGMTGRGGRKLVEGLKKSCLAPETLRLKKNARVMFVKNNFEEGFVNGTLGIVVDCDWNTIVVQTTNGRNIRVKPMEWKVDDNGHVLAQISQYPLRLAWAITIHKSQGMSLDAATVDLSQSFERGMGYVALSRIRSLQGLSLLGLNEMALKINEEALHFDSLFQNASAEHRAMFEQMTENEIREKQLAFLGPEPSEYQKVKIKNKIQKEKIKKEKKEKIPSTTITKDLISKGMSIKEVATERGMVFSTILNHLEELKVEDPRWNIDHIRSAIPTTRFAKIVAAFHKVGTSEGGMRPLTPVMNILRKTGGGYSFEELRLVRLFL